MPQTWLADRALPLDQFCELRVKANLEYAASCSPPMVSPRHLLNKQHGQDDGINCQLLVA